MLVKDYQSNPTVFGDAIQIQQVIINVMTNAIDALLESKAPQKEIRISFSSDESTATLTIQDNGGGIDSQILPGIFDLYKTTKKDGLGVGLWLSKSIMTHHQGSITAINDPKGWTVFKISLPIHHESSK